VFKYMSIRSKLLLLMLIVGLLSAASVGVLSYNNAKSSLTETIYDQLTALRETKKRQTEIYFKDQLTAFDVFSNQLQVSDALDGKQAKKKILCVPNLSERRVRIQAHMPMLMRNTTRSFYECCKSLIITTSFSSIITAAILFTVFIKRPTSQRIWIQGLTVFPAWPGHLTRRAKIRSSEA